MSFLIDELKKAEQQHRTGLRLEPSAPAKPPPPPGKTSHRKTPEPAGLQTLDTDPRRDDKARPVSKPTSPGHTSRKPLAAAALGLASLALLGIAATYTLREPPPAPGPGIAAAPEKVLPAPPPKPAPPELTPLQLAHAQLQQGDFPGAKTGFLKILAGHPADAAAWHGLAETHLRLGQLAQAEENYLQLLKLTPQDLKAQDGLIDVQKSGADARQAEIRLQALLAAHPELAFLNYGLGNVYVEMERWGEAQQAFLKAYQSDPEQPDYLFSLAVSLDYLGRTATARQLYRLALDAAERHPARFSPQQARKRLENLR